MRSSWLSSLLLAPVVAWAGVEPGPHLFLTTNDFARIRASEAAHVRRAVDETVRQAEALTNQIIEVPAEGGGWMFESYCPNDGAYLRRVAPGRFECPIEKKEFESPKAEAAYRTRLHDAAARDVETLGLAWQFSRRREFADKAAAILVRYADLYGGYRRHDRWGRTGLLAFMGGLRYAQALDEACGLIPCAWAYDLIRDSGALSAQQAAHVEKDFMRAAAGELQFPTFQQDNNHQTWLNAAVGSVGFTLNDTALIDWSLTGMFGFAYQMERCVTSDGLWHEGTMAYQNYAMQALVLHARMAAVGGRPIQGNARLRSLFDGPIVSAFPDGSYPIIHDSDPFNIRQFADLYEWAYAVYGDPRYGAVAALGNRGGRWAWMTGAATLPPEGLALPQTSRNLPGIGYLFLQRRLAGEPASLVVDYGPHGGDHGHPDKLSIILYAYGRDLFVDPGRITYSVPEYKTWCKQTVAHNTLVVDGASQDPTTGECLWFGAGDGFDAAAFRSDGAYGGVDLRRIVAMTDAYIVDCFRAESKRKHRYDLCLHVRGTADLPAQAGTALAHLDSGNGYEHLRGVRRLDVAGATGMTWRVQEGQAVKLLAPSPEGAAETWFVGTGIGTALRDVVPFLIRRRTGKAAEFCSVYEPVKGTNSTVTAVSWTTNATGFAVTVVCPPWQDVWQASWEAGTTNAPGREPSTDSGNARLTRTRTTIR